MTEDLNRCALSADTCRSVVCNTLLTMLTDLFDARHTKAELTRYTHAHTHMQGLPEPALTTHEPPTGGGELTGVRPHHGVKGSHW